MNVGTTPLQDSTARRIIAAITLLLLVPLFRPVVAPIDPVGYFAWARSALIDGDLDVANEFENYDMAAGVPLTANGYMHNQWPAGTGLGWLPALSLTHVAVLGANRLGAAVKPDGYSWPYAWAAALTSVAAGFGAVLMMYRLNRRYVTPFAALVATIVLWLATPLVFYQYHQPLMSHAFDALLHTLFIAVWLWADRERSRPISRITLGAVIGVAIWIRPQNVVMMIATLIVMAYEAVDPGPARSKTATLATRTGQLIIGSLMLVLPLMLFWQVVYGRWLVNPYQVNSGDSFDWRAPYTLQVLFSTDRGVFVWTPVLLCSIAGIKRLFRKAPKLALLLTIIVLLNLYVIGSWSTWSGGDAFGPRFWIGQLPFFSLALATLVEHLDRSTALHRSWIVGLAAGFIGWNFLLMLQYSLGILPPSGPVSLTRMIEQQALILPKISAELVERIRSILVQLR